MIDSHIKTTFPVYDSRDKQNFRRDWCMGDVSTFALVTSSWRLLPFQWERTLNASDFGDMTFLLFDYLDAYVDDITSWIPATDFNITTVDGVDWLTYRGNKQLTNELDCGTYYVEISDGINTWYTELFRVEQIEASTDVRSVRVISDGAPRKQRIIDTGKIRVIK